VLPCPDAPWIMQVDEVRGDVISDVDGKKIRLIFTKQVYGTINGDMVTLAIN
jgi:hypothetical protein